MTTTINAPSAVTTETLPEANFSDLYLNTDEATYADRVDDDTFLADFAAAATRFAKDPDTINECAHALPAFVMEVRLSDSKMNAALGKAPNHIARLLQAERVALIFRVREAAHQAETHG